MIKNHAGRPEAKHQRDELVNDFFTVGTVASILQMLKLPSTAP